MDAGTRQRLVGAGLVTLFLGIFAVAITDWPHGLITAGFVAVALIVTQNL